MFTVKVIFEDGLTTTWDTKDMAQAVVIWREQVKLNPNKLVELKFCKNYKEY